MARSPSQGESRKSRLTQAKRLRAAGLALLLLAVSGVAQGPPVQREDAAVKQVESLLKQARKEIRDFREGGDKSDDPNHPAVKWAAALWEFRQQNAGTPAAARATSEAVHLLIHADRFAEATAKADSVAPEDAAWELLAGVLLEAASIQNDYSFFIHKAELLLRIWSEEKRRAPLRFNLGRAYWQQGELDKAKAAFRAVLEEAPGSPSAQQAEGALYEITQLGAGQPAPVFSVRARDGSAISLEDFRGKAVLLIFWATT